MVKPNMFLTLALEVNGWLHTPTVLPKDKEIIIYSCAGSKYFTDILILTTGWAMG
jgi:hypothetical protein